MTMQKYLDPKADLTFKKVFGNHPDLLMSLLNALLPLDESQRIESIEYLPTEIESINPLRKNTIVDVRCKDICGRQFIVEMQMEWTKAFLQRVLFNASKAYVSQANKGFRYEKLTPVYSLSLINDTYTPKDNEYFIHNYGIVCDRDSHLVIDGLHFTLIELPKFKPQTIVERKMAVLWLRYLTEVSENAHEVSPDLLENPDTGKALAEVREAAFSEEELRAYEKFWDAISTERTLIEGRYREGMARGRKEGREEGREEGRAEGRAERDIEIARKMKERGMNIHLIAEMTGIPESEITEL